VFVRFGDDCPSGLCLRDDVRMVASARQQRGETEVEEPARSHGPDSAPSVDEGAVALRTGQRGGIDAEGRVDRTVLWCEVDAALGNYEVAADAKRSDGFDRIVERGNEVDGVARTAFEVEREQTRLDETANGSDCRRGRQGSDQYGCQKRQIRHRDPARHDGFIPARGSFANPRAAQRLAVCTRHAP